MIVLRSVVFVVGQLGNGGLERQLLYLIRQLRYHQVEVGCVVWNFNVNDHYVTAYRTELNEKLMTFPTGQRNWLKIQLLRRVLTMNTPQLVVSSSAFLNFPTWMVTHGLPCVALGSLRTSAEFYLHSGGIKARLNILFPSLILVNSHRAIKEFRHFPLLARFTNLAFLPNVIDIDKIHKKVITATEFQSISVGNARPAKRLDRLIEVMALLKERGQLNFFHFHIGAGPDLPNLRAAAAKAGLENNLHFLGPRDDVFTQLRKSSLFLHFSEHEGSPNVIMEAMAAGLPIVTTDCGDAGRYVKNGVNGYLIERFSTDLFASKIMILKQNEAERLAMSLRSLELIRKYDWSMLPQYFLEGLRQLNLNCRFPKEVQSII